jgi:hypothetical protein
MATIGNTVLTLLDHARRADPDGKIGVATIVEAMNRVNAITSDMSVIEGNTNTGHLTTIRTGLPAIAFRQLNIGVQPSKSTTKQIHFTAGMLEGMSKVDEELVEMAGDGPAFRASEVTPFMEAFGQTIASTLFYGDVRVNPDRFTGLSAYYNKLNATYQQNPDALVNPSTTLPDSGRNVIDASTNPGGQTFGDASGGYNTSMWLLCWGGQGKGITSFFPKGTNAGIVHKDKGLWLVDDGRGVGASFWAWIDQYKAKLGLAVEDWRQAVRICNIDVRALQNAGDDNDNSPNLIKNCIQAQNYIQNPNNGTLVWYCNRIVHTYLEVKALNKSNTMLAFDNIGGKRIVTLGGIPIHRCDALLNTESAVS